jgi:hypothetical protein
VPRLAEGRVSGYAGGEQSGSFAEPNRDQAVAVAALHKEAREVDSCTQAAKRMVLADRQAVAAAAAEVVVQKDRPEEVQGR